MACFEIQNLSFSYPGAEPSLRNVSLTVEEGEYLLICGKSGSGKTTLLRHLKTVLTPHGERSGTVTLNHIPLEQWNTQEQAAKIGFVMQSPDAQIVTDKVWHELSFGLESLNCEPSDMRRRVAEMASYFGIQDWFHRDISELSGGQKQLLNLAGVMAMHPDVLILDEPTSQLDPISASDFLNAVRKINLELGTTIILTEHRTEEVFASADRVIVMENGRIAAQGSPRTVCQSLWEQGSDLLGILPTPARVFYQTDAVGQCPLTVREGRRWLESCGGSVGCEPAAIPQQMHEAAIEARDVWFRYRRDLPDVLKGTNLTVPSQQLFAIVGGNGTGKSTMLRILSGVCRPYRGKLRLLGKPIGEYKGNRLYRGVLGMLPQDPRSLFVKRTVREELAEMSEDAALIRETVELCELDGLLDRHPYDLSGGEQQRTALAKVLLTRPQILLLDEPTKGMDSAYKKKFGTFLKQLTASGITVVIVAHDVEFCASYADSVSMFFDGQLLPPAPPAQFFGQNRFYTTAASRMSRSVMQNAVTPEDIAAALPRRRDDV